MRHFFAKIRSSDWLMHVAVLTLLSIGFAAIYSVALSQEQGDFLLIKKQAIAVAIGMVCMLILTASNFRLLRNYSVVMYVAGVLLLVGVLIFGTTIRGTTGWFRFGIIQFQPVEWMKVAFAVALAAYFSQRARRVIGWKEIFESGLLAALPVGLTMLQPDFGSAMLLLGMWGAVLLFTGIKRRYLVVLAGMFIGLAIFGWFFGLADYQRARIQTFLDPAADPLGQGYNVNQAMIAVGSGGWTGRGLGFGSQSQLKFLPESQTDFIFAVIAEELGFIGVAVVLMAFVLLFFRLYQHIRRATGDFSGYLLAGIGALLFLQFFVNVGMNLGLLPVTGLGLPFVSYGGSSLIFMLFFLGIIQSIAAYQQTSWHRT